MSHARPAADRPRARALRVLPWIVVALAVVTSTWGVREASRLRGEIDALLSERDALRDALARAEARARACAATAPPPSSPVSAPRPDPP